MHYFENSYHVSAYKRPCDEPSDAYETCENHDNAIAKSPESVAMIPVFEISLWIWRLYHESAFG